MLLAMRAELMARLRETIAERGWTQTEAASHPVSGNPAFPTWYAAREKFSLDMLVTWPPAPVGKGGGGDRLI